MVEPAIYIAYVMIFWAPLIQATSLPSGLETGYPDKLLIKGLRYRVHLSSKSKNSNTEFTK